MIIVGSMRRRHFKRNRAMLLREQVLFTYQQHRHELTTVVRTYNAARIERFLDRSQVYWNKKALIS